MADLPTFVNFTANGAFTNSQTLSLPNATNGLDFALKTYVTSESLLQNGWSATYLGNFSADTEVATPEDAPYSTNIAGGTLYSTTHDNDFETHADAVFWSSQTGRSYQLTHSGNKYSYNILSAINMNGWADLPTLFDGAFDCTFNGKSPVK